MKISEIDFGRLSALLLSVGLALFALYLAVCYLLPVLLPFLFAWGLALVLRPLNAYISQRTRLPLRLVSALSVLLSLLAVGGLLYGVGSRLVSELRGAIGELSGGGIPSLDGLSSLIPSGEGVPAGMDALLLRVIKEAANALLSALPPIVGGFVLSLPSALLFVFVSVVAAFYFSLDLSRVHAAVRAILPPSLSRTLSELRAGAFRLGLGYIRSYLILTGVIFLVMLLGLSLLGVRYALLLSIVLAAVDILPVIGVGTVLIPWGILAMVLGDTGLGVGLLVLFGASEIVRQVVEPRLLGSALGVHPLLSLFSLYLGARLFGFFGLILGPLLAVLLKVVFARLTELQKTKNPSCDGVSVGQARSTLPERRQREQT